MKTILILDDYLLGAKMVAKSLKNRYEVVVATRYADAVDIIDSEKPIDLVLSDYNLNEFSTGQDFVEYVAGKRPGIPIIVYTGESGINEVYGCSRILRKPVSPAELLEVLQTLLGE